MSSGRGTMSVMNAAALVAGTVPRRARMGAGAAGALVAGAMLCGVVGLAADVWATQPPDRTSASSVLVWIATAVALVVGAVVALARPDNRVGWALLVGAAASVLGGGGVAVADHAFLYGGHVPGASAYAVAGSGLRTVGWSLLTLIVPIYFPDGRIASSRWRWLPRLAAADIALGVVGNVFASHAQLNELSHWQNPVSNHAINAVADPASGLYFLLYAVVIGAAVAQLVQRWRRGDALLRQQIGLFAAVAVLPVFAVVLGVTGVTGAAMFGLMLLPLPVGIAFAVLARGLYDLATAANRSLVWLTLSATVVGIYALVIAGAGSLLHVHGSTWLPWVAAAVVALSFAPLRDALQRAVNRLTFGRWDDPYQVLAALGQHLEASADVDRLLTDVVDELESTLGLRQVSVTADDGTVLAGSASGGVDAVPLVAYGRPVGSLHFTTPTPLRPADRRLLDDLAGHLAGLLHARRLSGDLQRARERLVQAREEERRRLRRDLHDGLGPALAGHVLRADLAAHAFASGSPERASLEALRDDLRTTVAEVRRLVEGLRPPALDEMGLATALAQTIDRLTVGSGTACELELASLPPLSAAAEVAAYRIVTEAVTNVVRHGRAPHCRVAVDADERCLRLAVIDDGLGISSAAPRGHGLDTMRERAEELGGSFTVGRSPHGGTEVRAELPLASVPS